MIWPLEALNVLLVAERRGRVDALHRQRLAGFLHALPIKLDDETADQAWNETLHLAERFALSSYDAAYLELAQRQRLPLASLDEDLRTAAAAWAWPCSAGNGAPLGEWWPAVLPLFLLFFQQNNSG